jgi:Domain of unknown function (DUF1707)
MSETPETRIGDADRDKAAEYLREHMAAGRLDATEFDERLTKALTAKVASELDALFVDLPEPKPHPGGSLPAAEPYQAPPWQSSPASENQRLAERPPGAVPSAINKTGAILAAFAWPAAILLCFATGWRFWWIMLIPVFVSIGIRRWQQ